MSIIDKSIDQWAKDARVQTALLARHGGVSGEETVEQATKRILYQLIQKPEETVNYQVDEYNLSTLIDNIVNTKEAEKKQAVEDAKANYEATKVPIEGVEAVASDIKP